ncbi:hypothetical protein PM082_010991 [Marasmius tenuissimus]|nr:hypothetical protein PM082_010991 [Marasmius tenuissimus]
MASCYSPSESTASPSFSPSPSSFLQRTRRHGRAREVRKSILALNTVPGTRAVPPTVELLKTTLVWQAIWVTCTLGEQEKWSREAWREHRWNVPSGGVASTKRS